MTREEKTSNFKTKSDVKNFRSKNGTKMKNGTKHSVFLSNSTLMKSRRGQCQDSVVAHSILNISLHTKCSAEKPALKSTFRF